MNKTKTLEQLVQKREENILKTIEWSLDDMTEMLETYSVARQVAESENNKESLAIIEEKIAQLAQAKNEKEKLRERESFL